MKFFTCDAIQMLKRLFIFATVFGFCHTANAETLSVAFTNSKWTAESIPEGQQCLRFKGENPQSPELVVKNIPAGTTAIILEFSDRSFARMDKGGHGIVGFNVNAEAGAEVLVPAVPGHTETLPENFFLVANHKAPGWDKAGAYLPPCSGGRGNQYFIDVKAVVWSGEKIEKVLAETSIQMATF